MTADLRERREKLRTNLRDLPGALVAFSGGVDSSFLLYAAREALGDRVLAVTLATPYTPTADLAAARELAAALGVRHRIVEHPLPKNIIKNPPERCYLCKRELFSLLQELAAAEGLVLLDGSNTDDLAEYRPGRRALAELGVKSPLVQAGLDKAAIRELSRQAGLPTWNRAAGACLLTRLPHGMAVSEALLGRIDRAEDFLRSLGFSGLRVRCHGDECDLARIELPPEDIVRLLEPEMREQVTNRLKELGFRFVALDLAGYRAGSFDPEGTGAIDKK